MRCGWILAAALATVLAACSGPGAVVGPGDSGEPPRESAARSPPTEVPPPVPEPAAPVGDARPVITGRLIDASGRPIGGLELYAGFVEPGHPSLDPGDILMTSNGTTGADGRFRILPDRRPGATPSARLHLARKGHGPHASWGLKTVALVPLPPELRAGGTDVGDVVFRGGALLVGGVVVDGQGTALQGAVLRAMKTATYGVRAPVKGVDTAATDAEGRFRLEGDPAVGKVEVGVGCDGWYRESEAQFAAGTADARIVMQRAGGLSGSIKLPRGMDSSEVRIFVRGEPQRNGDIEYRFHGDGLSPHLKADGTFDVRNLRPGTARVVVRLGYNERDTVLALDDVVVEAGKETRDPRLQDFDPAASRRCLNVTVVDADGHPLSGAEVHYPAGPELTEWWHVTTDTSGTATAPLSTDRATILVTCDGYRTATARDVSERATVVLEAGTPTTVRLRLADGVPIPVPPCALTASLAWMDGTKPRDDYAGHDPRDLGRGIRNRFDTARSVSFQVIDPGRYRVQLGLFKAMEGGGGAVYRFPTVPLVVVVSVPGDGTPIDVAVDVDPKLLAGRIAR